jgi:hypothetical protein
VLALWQIFSSNKSVLANKKKGFYASRRPKNEEIVGIFVFSGSEPKMFFLFQGQNLKNQKSLAV